MKSLANTLFLLALVLAVVVDTISKRTSRRTNKSPTITDELADIGDPCNNSTECASGCCLLDDTPYVPDYDWEGLPTCQKMRESGSRCEFRTAEDGMFNGSCPCQSPTTCVEDKFPVVNDKTKVVEMKLQKICLDQRNLRTTKKPDETKPSEHQCTNSTQCSTGCCVFNVTNGTTECQNLGTIGSLCGNRTVHNVYIDYCPCKETLRCFSGNLVSFTPATKREPIQICVSRRNAHKTIPTQPPQHTVPGLRTTC